MPVPHSFIYEGRAICCLFSFRSLYAIAKKEGSKFCEPVNQAVSLGNRRLLTAFAVATMSRRG